MLPLSLWNAPLAYFFERKRRCFITSTCCGSSASWQEIISSSSYSSAFFFSSPGRPHFTLLCPKLQKASQKPIHSFASCTPLHFHFTFCRNHVAQLRTEPYRSLKSSLPILQSWHLSTRASLIHTTDLALSRIQSSSASPAHTIDLTQRPPMHRKTGSQRLLVVPDTSLSSTHLPLLLRAVIGPTATHHPLHHHLQPAALSLTTILPAQTTWTTVA